MPWLKIDDGLTQHRKWQGLSWPSQVLWLNAAVRAARNLRDGVVTPHDLKVVCAELVMPPKVMSAAVAELISRGLWEQAGEDLVFHDWLDWQQAAESVRAERARKARDQRLTAIPGRRQQIKDRDQDRCRYCAREVKWAARKGDNRGQIDHIDPTLRGLRENDPSNLVVSCAACNERKGSRTPEQAGMTLLPEP